MAGNWAAPRQVFRRLSWTPLIAMMLIAGCCGREPEVAHKSAAPLVAGDRQVVTNRMTETGELDVDRAEAVLERQERITTDPHALDSRGMDPQAHPFPARVKLVDESMRRAVIAIGTDQGVFVGQILGVRRGEQAMGTVEVLKVWPSKAVVGCDDDSRGCTIMKDDEVEPVPIVNDQKKTR